MNKYQILIIGAGITGSALAYVLEKYTNVKSVAILDKYPQIASVQSAKDDNSQTLHFGDIETNYTLEKARRVKKGADYVRVYVERNSKEKLHTKYQKMVLGVGRKEVESLQKRYGEFKSLFPDMHLLSKTEILQKEPLVVKGRKNVPLAALYSENGYTIDYQKLSISFLDKAKSVDRFLNQKVTDILKDKDGYVVKTQDTTYHAQYVVVSASSYSLSFAHKLGYKKNLILLPVMGDFFESDQKLQGKVYMVQKPKLPFAAIHGDPDVFDQTRTRYGPIAKIYPVLEKNNLKTVFDFMSMFKLNPFHLIPLLKIALDPTYLKFTLLNMTYSLPIVGKFLFAQLEVKKIIPTIKASELQSLRKAGGIRPQVIDTKTGKVELGEAKIQGDSILFNITPSPGASICLQNALEDIQIIQKYLPITFNTKKFEQDHT